MDGYDRRILTIIAGCLGAAILLTVVGLIVWLIVLRRTSSHRNRTPSSSHRQRYERASKVSRQDRKHLKHEFNGNESSISFSFIPPHLLNQNVKHLDRILASDSTVTAKSWQYEQTLPATNAPDG